MVEQETVTDEISPEPGTSLTVHSGFSGRAGGNRKKVGGGGGGGGLDMVMKIKNVNFKIGIFSK